MIEDTAGQASSGTRRGMTGKAGEAMTEQLSASIARLLRTLEKRGGYLSATEIDCRGNRVSTSRLAVAFDMRKVLEEIHSEIDSYQPPFRSIRGWLLLTAQFGDRVYFWAVSLVEERSSTVRVQFSGNSDGTVHANALLAGHPCEVNRAGGVIVLEIATDRGSYFALYCKREAGESLEQLVSSVPLRNLVQVGLLPRYEYLGGLVAEDSRDLFVRAFRGLFEFELIVLDHRD